jgi:transcriptional regulator with XRE-family HTH domain
MENIKEVLSQNLIKYRKDANLTQADLAKKINYSDKSISKWERGEAYPDIFTLNEIASVYGITVDRLLNESPKDKPKNAKKREIKRLIITILSTLLVWLVATSVYVISSIFMPNNNDILYKIFIIAIPISSIIVIIFSSLWHKPLLLFFSVTVLIWTTCLSVYLLLWNSWVLFLIGIPLQALEIFWLIYKQVSK